MKEESNKKRAKELAANAEGNIKSRRLTKVGSGILAGYLNDRPFIDLLSEDEQPHYFFFNDVKGVNITGKIVRAGWMNPYRSGMWITDRGIHFTVGRENGDYHFYLKFNIVDDIEVREGLTTYRFIYQTHRGEYQFPANASGPHDSAKSYIENQIENQVANQISSQSPPTIVSDKSTSDNVQTQIENRVINQKPLQSSQTNISDVSPLQRLQKMDEYKFEHLVADIWKNQGWEVNLTAGTADRGVDIIAIRDDLFEQRQLIQAKRYSAGNKVGSSEIQKYSGLYMRNELIDAVVVVTTSEFTNEAREVAKQRNVKTVNGLKLVKILEESEISSFEE
ncbi:restriction endonuclease [Halalkalicoccus subterraneus]|uniref:restriction endonuclease n=1 Tax=Halalkalicoccus subterraneus TaxID=2675002 RepID=UPI000EFA70C8|nr:restriction endonuclease [Halalkalicoccus subterraneus]